jgi:hypothetical protein
MHPLHRRLLILSLAALPLATMAQAKSDGKPAAADATPRVVLATSQGDITVELDAQRAPKSVANFLQYVRAGHYDGVPSRDRWLHDPGRRLHARHEAEADPRANSD